jgi:hypothetical protein
MVHISQTHNSAMTLSMPLPRLLRALLAAFLLLSPIFGLSAAVESGEPLPSSDVTTSASAAAARMDAEVAAVESFIEAVLPGEEGHDALSSLLAEALELAADGGVSDLEDMLEHLADAIKEDGGVNPFLDTRTPEEIRRALLGMPRDPTYTPPDWHTHDRSPGMCSMYGTCSGDPLKRVINCPANVPATVVSQSAMQLATVSQLSAC